VKVWLSIFMLLAGAVGAQTTGITIRIIPWAVYKMDGVSTSETVAQSQIYCYSADGDGCFPWPNGFGLACDPPMVRSFTPCAAVTATPIPPTATPTPTAKPIPTVRPTPAPEDAPSPRSRGVS
jgi:hypothetical protein